MWRDRNTQNRYFARVVKLDGDELTLGIEPQSGTPYKIKIHRSEILGKIVWKFDPGDEVKQLMRQIETKPRGQSKGEGQYTERQTFTRRPFQDRDL